MNVLILNSFRGKDIPYAEWLKQLNGHVYLLGSSQQSLQNVNFQKMFDDYESSDTVIDYAEHILSSQKIDRIIAKAEIDLIRSAMLREKYQIPGQSIDSAVAFRNKLVMKKYVEDKNIPIAKYREVNNKLDAINFTSDLDMPVIIKPVDGAGSVNIYKCNTQAEVHQLPGSLFATTNIIEEFVDGEMYHVDGIIIQNEIKFICPSKYTASCLAYQDNEGIGSILLTRESPLYFRLINLVKNVLEAMPCAENMTFHAEVFHTPDDDLIFCEIASRTGGGQINAMLYDAFGINLDKLWIQAQCNLMDEFPASWPDQPDKLSGWALIPPKAGIIIDQTPFDIPTWVTAYRNSAQMYVPYRAAIKSSDAIASFNVTGATYDEVQERLAHMSNKVNQSLHWTTTN